MQASLGKKEREKERKEGRTKGRKKGKKKPRVDDGHYEAGSDKQAIPPVVGGIFGEDAPPGREKQVKALKKKVGKDKAYAFTWAQHNKKK